MWDVTGSYFGADYIVVHWIICNVYASGMNKGNNKCNMFFFKQKPLKVTLKIHNMQVYKTYTEEENNHRILKGKSQTSF